MESSIETIQNFSSVWEETLHKIEKESEEFWESLTKDQQLKVFCAVMRRLYKGEIVEDRSYRSILYDVFGFGLEAYSAAQSAGFLDIHNSIDPTKR